MKVEYVDKYSLNKDLQPLEKHTILAEKMYNVRTIIYTGQPIWIEKLDVMALIKQLQKNRTHKAF